jgi:hypothetical protein
MKSDKLIQEELKRMKSLFDYERGKVVSEQNQGSGAFALANTSQTSSPMASAETQRMFAQGMSKAGQFGFEDYPIVDCGDIVKPPMVSPGGKEQKEFMKSSGLNPNSQENKKYYCSSNAMKSYLAQQKKTTTTKTPATPATPPPIPSELKDINGVKAFQDWLDTNKKGWASGYKDGILNKIGKGYGRMGPRTNKAWNLYKNEYLNPTENISEITPEEIKTINAGTQINQAATTTNTTTTDTTSNVVSPTPPDEPGQPGEFRDGWSWDEKQQKWFKPL